jgi:hypothetical protein
MTPSSSESGSPYSLSFQDVCRISDELIADLSARHCLTFPVPIRLLIEEVERRLSPGCAGGYKIRLHARSWGSSRVCGFVARYDCGADIHYSLSFNTCWRRFIIAKELAHLLIDNKLSFTTDPIGLVESLINNGTNMGNRADFKSEHISPVAAFEILLPWVLRKEIYEMRAAGSSYLQIGLKCRVPQKIVSYVLSDDYRNASEKNRRA